MTLSTEKYKVSLLESINSWQALPYQYQESPPKRTLENTTINRIWY
jgi:hypothetical protein